MAKSGSDNEEATKASKNVDGILEKYRKVRQTRNKSGASWSGPSHRKFSQYFDDSSSESETEEYNPDTSIGGKGDQASSGSATEAASDSDNLLVPSQKEIEYRSETQLKKFIGFSDSEPEDPEKEKIFQEKLKERRSRIGHPISSDVSVASRFRSNRTLNSTNNRSKFLPTRLSEVSPNLLDLSSSSDEDEVPFTRKTIESNFRTETRSSFRTPQKQKAEDLMVEFPLPAPKLNPDEVYSDDDEFVISRKPEATPVSQEITESPVISRTQVSAKKLSVSKEHSQTKKLSVSSAVKSLTFQPSPDKEVSLTVDENVRLSKGSSKKRLHVSTPKPKDLPPSKLLSNSKRRSHNSVTNKKQPTMTSKNTSTNISLSERASAPAASSAKFKSQQGNLPVADDEPVATFLDDEPIRIRLNRKATSTPHQETDQTLKKVSDVSDNSNKRIARKRSKSLVQGDKEISTEEVPRRILRSSSTQFTPEPAPIIPPKSHSTNIDINSKIESRDPTVSARFAEPSADALITAETAAEMNQRFMASSRIANDGDPVQSYIIHQTPALFTIMWKLLPNTCNWARTRGETCILVFEGEIEVANEVYPRGQVVKLTSDTTYLVKNVGESVALFQVVEYL